MLTAKANQRQVLRIMTDTMALIPKIKAVYGSGQSLDEKTKCADVGMKQSCC